MIQYTAKNFSHLRSMSIMYFAMIIYYKKISRIYVDKHNVFVMIQYTAKDFAFTLMSIMYFAMIIYYENFPHLRLINIMYFVIIQYIANSHIYAR